MGFLITFTWLPKEPEKSQGVFSLSLVFASFKGVLSNVSATACLLGNVFSLASTTAVLLFNASFQRQVFGASLSLASLIILGSSLCYTAGSFLAGRLVRSYGMKWVTVISAVIAGVLTVLFTEMPFLWLSVAVVYVSMFFSGARVAASNSLAIEQVPRLSGMMMSFNLAASYLGQSLGGGLGGLFMVYYGYSGMSLGLGILGVFAGLIYYFKAVDPTKAT
jgi:predicted MFS family arabinose efflux permease